MRIILKNIPAKTQKRVIKKFLEPTVKGSWLNESGVIKNIIVLPLKNTRTRFVHHHALVDVFPDSVAERVINKLNRKPMAGKLVGVAEYVIRDPDHDTRYQKCDHHDDLEDRRFIDRRGEYEVEEPLSTSRVVLFDND